MAFVFSSKKIFGLSPKTLLTLCFALSLNILVSACASKTSTQPMDYSADQGSTYDFISTDEARYEDYNIAIGDDGIDLTDAEKKAFQSIGQIDQNLTADDLALIRKYYKSYLHKSRKTISRYMYRAIPYIAFTREVFRSRGLPEELAFLAFIESGYNPWAVSRSNAVGMWQFMAPTGRFYGLVQDWWMDDRRDPYKATHAAADYLAKLYNDFGDWHLAIAAYNAGEGKIGRAIKATGATTFFELLEKNHKLSYRLRLREETLQYVPRFIAMAKIMRNFEMLGFEPEAHTFAEGKPIIPMPAVEINAKPGTDLATIAEELNMDWSLFAAYNPAYHRYITPPTRETKFYVPFNLHEKAIAASKVEKNTGLSHYRVGHGDTLSKISKKVGVPVSVLRQMNTNSEPLQVGTLLKVPGRAGQVNEYVAKHQDHTATTMSSYTVRKGDTFSQIASKHKVTTKQLAAANPKIKNIRRLKIGQKINVPVKSSASYPTYTPTYNPPKQNNKPQAPKDTKPRNTTPPQRKPEPQASQTSQVHTGELPEFHTLVKGDTFYSIARQYGMSVSALGEMNAGLNVRGLSIGDKVRLRVPSEYIAYTVKAGDTLSTIARDHNISLGELKESNKDMGSFSSLAIGQTINLPTFAMDAKAQTVAIEPQTKQKPTYQTPPKQKTQEPKPSGKTTKYTVKKGDTFHSIAQRFGMKSDELALANPQIFSRAQISIGQTILIPNDMYIKSAKQELQARVTSYTVKKGDTYWNIAQRHNMKTNELLQLNNLSSTDILSIGMKIKVYK